MSLFTIENLQLQTAPAAATPWPVYATALVALIGIPLNIWLFYWKLRRDTALAIRKEVYLSFWDTVAQLNLWMFKAALVDVNPEGYRSAALQLVGAVSKLETIAEAKVLNEARLFATQVLSLLQHGLNIKFGRDAFMQALELDIPHGGPTQETWAKNKENQKAWEEFLRRHKALQERSLAVSNRMRSDLGLRKLDRQALGAQAEAQNNLLLSASLIYAGNPWDKP